MDYPISGYLLDEDERFRLPVMYFRMKTRQQVRKTCRFMISRITALRRLTVSDLFLEEYRETNTRFPFFGTSLRPSDTPLWYRRRT